MCRRWEAEGYEEGLRDGQIRSFDEGWELGWHEGCDRGRELGRITRFCLEQYIEKAKDFDNAMESAIRRACRLVVDICAFSLSNEEDALKDASLQRIRAAAVSLGYRSVSDRSSSPSLDF